MVDNLKFYNNSFPDASSAVDSPTLITGTGAQTTYSVPNASRVGATLQYSNVQKLRYMGGFTVNTSNNTVTINTAPPANSQGIIPGLNAITSATYDQASVSGVSNPLVKETKFWMFNIDDIHVYKYFPKVGEAGMLLTVLDSITSAGIDLSWVQLACSDPITGEALTYAATGVDIEWPELAALGTIAASAAAGASSLTVTLASSAEQFYAGDYAVINFGNSSSEERRIYSVTPGATTTVLTFHTAFTNSHAVGETVIANGREAWLKQTTPAGATSGEAENFYDLYLQLTGDKMQRL